MGLLSWRRVTVGVTWCVQAAVFSSPVRKIGYSGAKVWRDGMAASSRPKLQVVGRGWVE